MIKERLDKILNMMEEDDFELCDLFYKTAIFDKCLQKSSTQSEKNSIDTSSQR